MNILIIGSAAREHAIASALHRSPQQPHLYCCGTSVNPGIKQMTFDYWTGDITDVATVVNQAKQWHIGLAIIGPEAPLEKGLADALWQASIPTIGPKQTLAKIETSKSFARDLMAKHHIKGLPQYKVFHDMNGINEFLEILGEHNYVIKADGLMGGKGVKVGGDHLTSMADALAYCKEIFTKSKTCVIEEKLVGQEFTFMGFCDGEHIVPMPVVQDHKRAFVGDKGPNTGGMGSYSSADHSLPFLSQNDINHAWQINEAVYRALMAETHEKYIGILYGSFIATKHGVYVIEFNARFGDPEALNVLTILQSDFVEVCDAMATGNLTADKVVFAPQATVCKYAVPNGYPDATIKSAAIDISAVKNKANLYLASVDMVDGRIMATNSRTAAYVGVAETISNAEEVAEREVRGIAGPLFHREDIGTDMLIQQRVDHMRRLRSE